MANILWPVDDLAVALAFYRNAVGLPVRFTGGERFAALDAGGTTLALVAGGEDVTSGAPAISVKVADVADAVERLTGAGARIVSPPSEGPPTRSARCCVTRPDNCWSSTRNADGTLVLPVSASRLLYLYHLDDRSTRLQARSEEPW